MMNSLKRNIRLTEIVATVALTLTIASATSIASALEQNKTNTADKAKTSVSVVENTTQYEKLEGGILLLNAAGQEIDPEGNIILPPAPEPEPTPEPAPEPPAAPQPSIQPAAYGATLIDAAESQLGQNQDCTALVERALRAIGVGIGDVGPMGFAGLGTQVSPADAQPGDIMMRNGHVAIYLGNGMAVHGGYNGTTVNAPGNPNEYSVIVRL